jgi:cobalamin synthase
VHIDWATLSEVAVVAAAASLTVVLLVAFAVVGLSTRPARGLTGDRHGAEGHGGAAVAVLCAGAAALIVGYGLYLVVA